MMERSSRLNERCVMVPLGRVTSTTMGIILLGSIFLKTFRYRIGYETKALGWC